MYVPSPFAEGSVEDLCAFMAAYDFATVVTQSADGPFASHLPLLVEPRGEEPPRLLGHVARANPQWQHLAGDAPVLAIFHGPHAYLSPRWYGAGFAVPTWNYAVVHAAGTARLVDDPGDLRRLLKRLVAAHEPAGGWSPPWDDPRAAAMLDAIVGFEIDVTDLRGKYKLSQNRPRADRAGVVTALEGAAHEWERQVGQLMRERLDDAP